MLFLLTILFILFIITNYSEQEIINMEKKMINPNTLNNFISWHDTRNYTFYKFMNSYWKIYHETPSEVIQLEVEKLNLLSQKKEIPNMITNYHLLFDESKKQFSGIEAPIDHVEIFNIKELFQSNDIDFITDIFNQIATILTNAHKEGIVFPNLFLEDTVLYDKDMGEIWLSGLEKAQVHDHYTNHYNPIIEPMLEVSYPNYLKEEVTHYQFHQNIDFLILYLKYFECCTGIDLLYSLKGNQFQVDSLSTILKYAGLDSLEIIETYQNILTPENNHSIPNPQETFQAILNNYDLEAVRTPYGSVKHFSNKKKTSKFN